MDDAATEDSTKVDVFFRGDLAPGQNVIAVRERLQKLFNANEEQLQRMFSGRPIAIRRDIDLDVAEQYEAAMLKVGALVELRPVKSTDDSLASPSANETSNQDQQQKEILAPTHQEQATEPQTKQQNPGKMAQTQAQQPDESTDQNASPFSIAPVGADVLREEDRAVVKAVDVDISALAVEDLEGDILQDSEKRCVDPVDVDTSHLSVEELSS